MIFINKHTSIKNNDGLIDVINYDDLKAREQIDEVFKLSKEKYNKYIGLDYETNGLCPILNTPLLLGIGLPELQVAIECHNNNPYDLFPDDWEDYIYVAHNGKFDHSIAEANHKVELKKLFDTMVADQKVMQNMGVRNNYEACLERYLNIELEGSKDTRLEFVGKDPLKDPYYTKRQIYYLQEDVKYLVPLKDQIVKQSNRFNLTNWLYSVELQLPRILGNAENRGLGFDWDGLTTLIDNNEKEQYETAVALDNELQRLADTLGEEKYLLKGGIYTNKRNFYDPSAYQYDLFTGKPTAKGIVVSSRAKKFPYKKATANAFNVNWNSDNQIIEIFARLKEPLMTKDGSYAIPFLKPTKGVYTDRGLRKKKNGDFVKVIVGSYQTNKKAFAQYLIELPNTKCAKLINLLVKYAKITHEINAFGYGYLKKKNPITGLIHTIYRQASTANSRFSSGGGSESEKGDKKEMSYRYNSQNTPRDNKIRNLFRSPNYDKGWKVATSDLSGAEVTIICDKAHDEVLYEMAVKNDDVHSPIVQNSWRYLYLYRAAKEAKIVTNAKQFLKVTQYGNIEIDANYIINTSENEKAIEYAHLAKEFIVSKKVNKPYRQGGKNNTFGSIYNMGKETAAATYNGTTAELKKVDPTAEPVNVTPDEASVALWAIKNAIPKTFAFVEKQVERALIDGYLILNKRSYSRAWFRSVVQLKAAINDTIKENAQAGVKSRLASIDRYTGIYELNTNEQFTLDWKEAKEIDGQARNLPISGTQADMIKESIVVIQSIINKYKLRGFFLLQVHDELVYDYDPTMGEITYEYDGIEFTHKFPELLKNVMSLVSTKYLIHYTMHADVDDFDYWTKG